MDLSRLLVSARKVHGYELAVNGSDLAMHGSDLAKNGSDLAELESEPAGHGSDLAELGSEPAEHGSELAVHGYEPFACHVTIMYCKMQSHPLVGSSCLIAMEHSKGVSSISMV